MYAKKAIIYGITIIGAIVLAAVAVHPLQKASATPQVGVKVTNIGATPNLVAPIDVLTINTTVANEAATADDLTIKMTVRDEAGQPVLEEKQSGISVSHGGKQSVYWTWRIPGRLNDGVYSIEMTVVGGGEKVLATDTRDAAFKVDRTGSVMARSGQ